MCFCTNEPNCDSTKITLSDFHSNANDYSLIINGDNNEPNSNPIGAGGVPNR